MANSIWGDILGAIDWDKISGFTKQVLRGVQTHNGDMAGTAEEQDAILKEINALGYNVVECPDCVAHLLVRDASTVDTYKCFLCDSEFESSDCSDLVFPDKNGYFVNT